MIDKAADILGIALKFLIIVITGCMFVTLFMQVLARYIFTYSINWADGTARYLLCWMTFLAATIATREDGHIKITIISERLKGKVKIIWEILLNLFFLAITVFLVCYGSTMTKKIWLQQTDALPISMGWVYLSIPVSQVVCSFYLIIIIVKELSELFDYRAENIQKGNA